MKTNISHIKKLLRGAFSALLLLPQLTKAAVFDGGGIWAGLGAANNINGLTHQPLRFVIINIVIRLLNFLALAATIVIVAAGVYLILGFGEDDAREKAKKMITYTAVGLFIVFVARVIVGFVFAVLR